MSGMLPVVSEGLSLLIIALCWAEDGIKKELAILKECLSSTLEEVGLIGACVQDDETAIMFKTNEYMADIIAEPKGTHLAVATTGEMISSVMNVLKQTVRTELFIRKEIQQDLPTPAEDNSINSTGVLKPFQSGAKRRSDDGSHNLMPLEK